MDTSVSPSGVVDVLTSLEWNRTHPTAGYFAQQHINAIIALNYHHGSTRYTLVLLIVGNICLVDLDPFRTVVRFGDNWGQTTSNLSGLFPKTGAAVLKGSTYARHSQRPSPRSLPDATDYLFRTYLYWTWMKAVQDIYIYTWNHV